MEVFAGQNDAVFLPTTLTGDAPSDDRIPPPAAERQSLRPPQKLRPIRCNGRGPADGLDAGLSGAASAELGFLTQLSSQKQGPVFGANVSQPDLGNGGGEVAGNVCSAAEPPPVSLDKAGMGAECMKLVSEGLFSETDLSVSETRLRILVYEDFRNATGHSSSDDGIESSEAMKEPLSRKRKRKTMKKLELCMESMIRKVMQRQDQLHKQLIETLEEKEKERIIREEAWKQREIERARREEEVRAQETSRSLALISLIQNLSGHDIQLPKSLETSWLEKYEGEIHNQEDFRCDQSNRRWPKSEVQALITVRTALNHKFLNGPKSSVWEEVAVGLSKMGYSRSAKKCKEKWENIKKYYKRTIDSGKKRPENSKACPYFHELDILYSSGLISSGSPLDNIKKEFEEKGVTE
ncbi:hypothetical protein RJ640_008033 [Escallonia rubra]|uniref:Myb-like domain-containing protein n=1 Tax=Escallonia rubra TaxID=112253 RepID=A0AA88QTC6_9ASTE|nr:hypothetical protein RJ640_008031 [Escallonia rubra]KAK2975933.1 hypothetical protein RJ640_008033 [Escallonia rubra]